MTRTLKLDCEDIRTVTDLHIKLEAVFKAIPPAANGLFVSRIRLRDHECYLGNEEVVVLEVTYSVDDQLLHTECECRLKDDSVKAAVCRLLSSQSLARLTRPASPVTS